MCPPAESNKLAAGLGEPWCGDGCIPQGCSLSVVFVAALYVPGVGDWRLCVVLNPSCTRIIYSAVLCAPGPFFWCCKVHCSVCLVGWSGCFSSKCVLLSTSKAVRNSIKLWDVSGDGMPWKVELDVRDLGGHLDFTRRARAGW